MKQLEKNEHAVKVQERSITYCSDFKIKAVKAKQSGKMDSQKNGSGTIPEPFFMKSYLL